MVEMEILITSALAAPAASPIGSEATPTPMSDVERTIETGPR